MAYRDLTYWTKGFNFSRNVHGDRVVVEVYRLLKHYTAENPNCRAGMFIEKVGESPRFYSINDMTDGTFDILVQKSLDARYKELPADSMLATEKKGFAKAIEDFQTLKTGVNFYYQTKSFWGSYFGYSFKNCITIKVNPAEIIQVEGNSLDDFYIRFQGYYLDVAFRDIITIATELPARFDDPFKFL